MSLLTYLAAPYSSPDEAVRGQRVYQINEVTAELLRNGHHVYSPITHCHVLAEMFGLPRGWDFWHSYDRRMIQACDSLAVLMIDGWQTSVGVNAELDIASELGKPIHYYNLKTKIFSPTSD